MPTTRETVLAALLARLQPLTALTLREEVLPERIPAAGLITETLVAERDGLTTPDFAQICVGLGVGPATVQRFAETHQGVFENLTGLARSSEHLAASRKDQIRRELDGLELQRGVLEASIAKLGPALVDPVFEILRQRTDRAPTMLDELQQAQINAEELRILQDRQDRAVIRAPVAGFALGMKVHTSGPAVASATPLMDMVPQGDDLTIEATGDRYFLAQLRMPAEALAKLPPNVALPLGMPADVFLIAGERTFADDLLAPIRDTGYRAFLEG